MLAVSIACAAAAVAWLYLVAAHGGYWRTSQRLPRVSGEPDAWPDVVAVVPARNEAEMLPVTLPALLGQDYPGALTVIVVDDGSSDGTGEVAARIAAGAARPLRAITWCSPTPTSPGRRTRCAAWWSRPRATTGTWSRRWPCCARLPAGSVSWSPPSSTSSPSSTRSGG